MGGGGGCGGGACGRQLHSVLSSSSTQLDGMKYNN